MRKQALCSLPIGRDVHLGAVFRRTPGRAGVVEMDTTSWGLFRHAAFISHRHLT